MPAKKTTKKVSVKRTSKKKEKGQGLSPFVSMESSSNLSGQDITMGVSRPRLFLETIGGSQYLSLFSAGQKTSVPYTAASGIACGPIPACNTVEVSQINDFAQEVISAYETHLALNGADTEFVAELTTALQETSIKDEILSILDTELASAPTTKTTNLTNYINQLITASSTATISADGDNILTAGTDGGPKLTATGVGFLVPTYETDTTLSKVEIDNTGLVVTSTVEYTGEDGILQSVSDTVDLGPAVQVVVDAATTVYSDLNNTGLIITSDVNTTSSSIDITSDVQSLIDTSIANSSGSMTGQSDGHTIATYEGQNNTQFDIQETITSLGTPTLVGNLLTIPFTNENSVTQTVNVDLGSIATNTTGGITNATYNASTNIITIDDGATAHQIDLSEFSIIATTQSNGDVIVEQEGVTKFTVPAAFKYSLSSGVVVTTTTGNRGTASAGTGANKVYETSQTIDPVTGDTIDMYFGQGGNVEFNDTDIDYINGATVAYDNTTTIDNNGGTVNYTGSTINQDDTDTNYTNGSTQTYDSTNVSTHNGGTINTVGATINSNGDTVNYTDTDIVYDANSTVDGGTYTNTTLTAPTINNPVITDAVFTGSVGVDIKKVNELITGGPAGTYSLAQKPSGDIQLSVQGGVIQIESSDYQHTESAQTFMTSIDTTGQTMIASYIVSTSSVPLVAQADWNETDISSTSYIQNKPVIEDSAASLEVTQATHGFVALDWIRYDETTSTWMKAKSDDITTLGAWHVVEVVNPNTFKAAKSGTFSIPNSLTEGEYVLSDSIDGGYTQTAPTATTSYILYGMEVIDTNTVNFYPSAGTSTVTSTPTTNNVIMSRYWMFG